MTLALALLPLLALLTLPAGLLVTPVTGLLTALSILLLRHASADPFPAVILFAAMSALILSVAPTWWLGRYTDETGPSQVAGAVVLSLVLMIAASLSLPSEDMLQSPALLSAPFIPIDGSVVTVALGVTFIGLATLSLRSGARYQLAGLLTACDGLLLTAANIRNPYAGWLIGVCLLLLAGAGTWLVRRLSLLRMKSAERGKAGF
ncbi:MAG: hypothetical protein ABF876_04645 [Acetobacter aceti]|uniref:Uncharacterized protein n=1 Tax=Acetobacter aceti TaxID=435 RepID=A0A1U9KEF2_ACEAC|nr:hypothetical protein [Acetobacter aceti]AQS84194.1 hypothetical protein A0U92_04740 [Acetobacter aceti]